MPERAKFSVVISTYNRRAMLLECIRSVSEQTFAAHEIIVAVDGSTDGTADAIRQHFPNVIVCEQPNRGRSVASNHGVSVATGDWICFLDDDDLWHRQKLELTAEYLEQNPDCQAVNTPVWFYTISPDGPTGAYGFKRDFVATSLEECHQAVANGDPSTNEYRYLQIHGNSLGMLLERNRGTLSASVIRRGLVIQAGGFSPMQACGDDWTLFVNIARLCEWHTMPRRLTFCQLHCGQSTGSADNEVMILAGQVNAWYSGRPLRDRIGFEEMLAELTGYGTVYRLSVQSYFWNALLKRRFRHAAAIRRLGRMLLPRFIDRVYATLPLQITWRWERYFKGMHR